MDRSELHTHLLRLTVAEILDRWPVAAGAFINHRLACIGCDFSPFDTLAEALAVHHIPPQTFLNQLSDSIDASQSLPQQGDKPLSKGENP